MLPQDLSGIGQWEREATREEWPDIRPQAAGGVEGELRTGGRINWADERHTYMRSFGDRKVSRIYIYFVEI
jgi:hypothetical protein